MSKTKWVFASSGRYDYIEVDLDWNEPHETCLVKDTQSVWILK